MKIAQKILPLIFFPLFLFCLESCSPEENPVEKPGRHQRTDSFIFELNRYHINGESQLKNPGSLYMPESLEALIRHRFFEDGCVFFVAERPYPASLGLIDSSSFYDEYSDSADWVDSCILRVEEERIAAQIESLEENFAEEEPEYTADAPAETQEAPESPEPPVISDKPSREIMDKNNSLAFAEFDKEKFVAKSEGTGRILIYASDGNVLRRFYDGNLRLVKEENWSIKSADNAELKKSTSYNYNAGSGILSSKKISEKDSSQLIFYTEDGLVYKKESYALLEGGEKILSSISRTYNAERKVLSESSIDYVYSDAEYSKLDYSYEKRYDYAYNEGEIPPDFKYYENGMLKMQNKYSTEKGSYTSQIFFDDDYSVKTYYEDGLRVREVFFINGAVRRERYYEAKSKDSE